MALIPIFRFFFADSDFLMALIPIFENLCSVVIHREEKDGEAWRNFHFPRKKKRKKTLRASPPQPCLDLTAEIH